jgi:predicted nucleotidyltransferase
MGTESLDDRSRRERYAPYVEAWRQRLAAQRKADEARRAPAIEEARRAAKILAERYGVSRVILFGSLVWRRFGSTSDIDLAVEGLALARFFRADAELAREILLPVDLKLLSECPPLLRSRIEEEGVTLHAG